MSELEKFAIQAGIFSPLPETEFLTQRPKGCIWWDSNDRR